MKIGKSHPVLLAGLFFGIAYLSAAISFGVSISNEAPDYVALTWLIIYIPMFVGALIGLGTHNKLITFFSIGGMLTYYGIGSFIDGVRMLTLFSYANSYFAPLGTSFCFSFIGGFFLLAALVVASLGALLPAIKQARNIVNCLIIVASICFVIAGIIGFCVEQKWVEGFSCITKASIAAALLIGYGQADLLHSL